MKKRRKDRIPICLAVLICLILGIVKSTERITLQQIRDFEVFCNLLLLIIAVLNFLWFGLPAKENSDIKLENILGNISVSILAFVINIGVFEHKIRLKAFYTDLLWGWHLYWIFCFMVQVLFLTKLGEKLLAECRGFLSWVKKLVGIIGNILLEILIWIKTRNKNIFLIIVTGIILWILYFASRLKKENDIYIVLSDSVFLLGSVRLFIAVFGIGLIVYNVRSIFENIKKAIEAANIKKVLAILGGIILTIAIVHLMPFWEEVLKAFVIIVTIIVGIIWSIIKMIKKRNFEYVNSKDLIVLLLAYLIMPSLIILVVMFFSGQGQVFEAQGVSDVAAWKNLWDIVMDIVRMFLQLYGI